MSTYRLDHLFAPRSIVLIGGSPKSNSVGGTTLRNLRAGGFGGRIDVINRKYPEIEGIKTLPDIRDVPETPDLAIISVPPSSVEKVVKAVGARGCPAAMVLTAGLDHGTGSFTEAIAQTARATGLRLIGPSLGILVPRINLNASFASRLPKAGELALISQSGAISTALVEWAMNRNVGFSAIASMTENLDVDFSDLLDYFALDTDTRAILLYVEFDQRRAQLCPRHVRRHASSQWLSSNPVGTRKGLVRLRRIPVRWRDRMPSTMRRSEEPAWCACSIWMNYFPPLKRWGTCNHPTVIGLQF